MMGTVMRLSSPVIWNLQAISVRGIQPPLLHLHPQQIPKVIPHTSQLKCPDSLRTHHHLYLSPHQLNKMHCLHLLISHSSIFLAIMRVIWTVLFLESPMMKNDTFLRVFCEDDLSRLGTSTNLNQNMSPRFLMT